MDPVHELEGLTPYGRPRMSRLNRNSRLVKRKPLLLGHLETKQNYLVRQLVVEFHETTSLEDSINESSGRTETSCRVPRLEI